MKDLRPKLKKTVKVEAKVRVNVYAVVSEAVEHAVQLGYTRSLKHSDTPQREAIEERIRDEVMNALCDILDFG